MTRDELIENICPSFIDCKNTDCKTCEETLNKGLDEYDVKVRETAIEECIKDFKSLPYKYMYKSQIIEELEKLKEQTDDR